MGSLNYKHTRDEVATVLEMYRRTAGTHRMPRLVSATAESVSLVLRTMS